MVERNHFRPSRHGAGIGLGLASALVGCLYSGEGTLGLPCNTDLECGGTQACVEHVCGGPQAMGPQEGSTGATTDAESSSGGEVDTISGGDDEQIRTMCEPSETECLDDETLRKCEDGKLSTRDCRGFCGEAQPTNGCSELDDGENLCLCLNSWATCTAAQEGTSSCDGNNGRACTDGYWIAEDCDTVCVEGGYPGGSDHCEMQGSTPTCICNETCVEGAMRCVDSFRMAQCSGGSWTTYDCDQICKDNDYRYSPGCTYFAGDTEACGCL